VLVTGAASGIGHQALSLFHARHDVAIGLDINPITAPCSEGIDGFDVSDEDAWRRAVGHVLDQYGRIDVLCNNAGTGSTSAALECTVDEWERVFRVNALGTFLGVRAVLPTMLTQRRGTIVNTASAAGMIGVPNRAAYCASKGAVIAFTKQVAVDYVRQGIRSNCVCPGTVDSPWVSKLVQGTADPAAAMQSLEGRQPMGRLATPFEIAKAIEYLASDDAAFMTGSSLVIDGGIQAGIVA
jgi:NAD(P)-dependent dehydrogenase (short-subunit alcohol dehydrogenase family)